MNSFYTENEINKLGLKVFGKNVLISKMCSIYGAENISIGDNVRIDDFCILSGNITIGNYVHISAGCFLYGSGGIEIGNFCGMSSRSTIYSATDDFSGEFMISPLAPMEFTNVIKGAVVLKDYAQLGSNTTVMPAIILNEGSVTGAFSLVLEDLAPWTINIGIPAKKIKDRSKNIVCLSKGVL